MVDERFVPATDDDSNEKLVRECLLHKDAHFISFAPAYAGETLKDGTERINASLSTLASRFDVVILGMGEDGHTASLFPHHKDLQQGLETTALCIAVEDSPKPPAQRISLTQHAIVHTTHLFLHITGEAKRSVYETAAQRHDAASYPISAFIHQKERALITYWAA